MKAPLSSQRRKVRASRCGYNAGRAQISQPLRSIASPNARMGLTIDGVDMLSAPGGGGESHGCAVSLLNSIFVPDSSTRDPTVSPRSARQVRGCAGSRSKERPAGPLGVPDRAQGKPTSRIRAATSRNLRRCRRRPQPTITDGSDRRARRRSDVVRRGDPAMGLDRQPRVVPQALGRQSGCGHSADGRRAPKHCRGIAKR